MSRAARSSLGAPRPVGQRAVPGMACELRCGSSTLSELMGRLIEGGAAPPGMLVASLGFVPKTEDLANTGEVTRSGEALRPIALQNTDGKAVAAAAARTALRAPFQACAAAEQRGFFLRRSLVHSIVDMNVQARSMAVFSPTVAFSRMFFLDFLMAWRRKTSRRACAI